MKKIYMPLITTILLISCNSHKQRIEEKMIECQEISFSGTESTLKEKIKSYEELLIKEGFLEDGSGKSYYKFYNRLINNPSSFTSPPSEFFALYDTEPNKEYLKKGEDCMEQLKKDSLKYDWTKIKEIDKVVEKLPKRAAGIDAILLYKTIFTALNEADLELDYYKMLIFKMAPVLTQQGNAYFN